MSPRFVTYGGLYLKLMILIKTLLIFLTPLLVAVLSVVTYPCFLYASIFYPLSLLVIGGETSLLGL